MALRRRAARVVVLRRRHGSAARAAGAGRRRHIVVGTPGRLRDHLERGQLRLDGLKVAVLDEADEMLDLGFREELEAILDATPRRAAHPAVLRHPAQADHRRWPRRYQRDALRLDRRPRPSSATPTSTTAPSRIAPSEVEHAMVNVLRYFEARRGPGVLRHPRGGAQAARQPGRARLLGGGPVGRADPGRAHPRAAGPAGPPRAGLRGHRRGRARHRHSGPRAGDPRRPAQRSRGAAASLGPHRPGRAQGRLGAAGAPPAPPPRRGCCCASPRSRRAGARRPRPRTSAPATRRAWSNG